MKPFSNTLITTVSALAILLGPIAAAGVVLAPQAAYAKSDKSNGKGAGREKSERGKSGKSDRSSSSSRSKDKGKSQFAKSKAGTGNGRKLFAGSAAKKGAGTVAVSRAFSELGDGFRRDVNALFGRETPRRTDRARRGTVSDETVVRLESSPRPEPRLRRDYPVETWDDRHPRRHHDPLVAAITDPLGSDKLRNLSASNAAAPAFRNAAPNSNVGKIAAYQVAASDYYTLGDELLAERRALRDLVSGYDGRTTEEIRGDLQALDPNDPGYDEAREELLDELGEAASHEREVADLRRDIRETSIARDDALETAEAAFFDASKGRTVTRETLAEFHDNLALPAPEAPFAPHHGFAPLPDYPQVWQAPLSDDQGRWLTAEDIELPHDPVGTHDPLLYPRGDTLVRAITGPDGTDKLRNLNAAGASPQALRNASANSNVGRIASYQTAATTYYDLRDELAESQHALRELDASYDGRSSAEVFADLEALDPTAPDYDETLAALTSELEAAEAHEATRDGLAREIRVLTRRSAIASREAEAAFFEASMGTTLFREALAELNADLGLPAPAQ